MKKEKISCSQCEEHLRMCGKHFYGITEKRQKEIKEEIKEEIREQVGFLRQYLNERTSKKLITDKEIKTFLNL